MDQYFDHFDSRANLSSAQHGIFEGFPGLGGGIRWIAHISDQLFSAADLQKIRLHLDVFVSAGILSILAYWMGLFTVILAFLRLPGNFQASP